MRIFLLGLFLLPLIAVMAGQRSADQAAEIAARFCSQQPQVRQLPQASREVASVRLVHEMKKRNKDEAAFYVFNQTDEKGFVIVSADDRTTDEVLAYSDEGTFDAEKINPAFAWWLSRFANEISSIEDDAEPYNAPAADSVEPIAPLLVNQDGVEITWYQEKPYNNLCPIDKLDNTRSYTGCVATAAAMIMYKWHWPKTGVGRSSYTWQDCLKYNNYSGDCTKSVDTILTANYAATTYDWNNMLPAYKGQPYTTAQAKAVATLMYHAGVASEMGYGGDKAGGSGTMTDNMAFGLAAYFDYKYDKYITMYGQSDWDVHDNVPTDYNVDRKKFIEYFNADLEAGRPIIMGGESGSSGGHEFVCDGRDKDGKFHINWGWEGEGNCYTTLYTLQPSGETDKFKDGLDAIIGLRPNAPYAVAQTEAASEKRAHKVLQNGQVLIVRENVRYNVLGQTIQ